MQEIDEEERHAMWAVIGFAETMYQDRFANLREKTDKWNALICERAWGDIVRQDCVRLAFDALEKSMKKKTIPLCETCGKPLLYEADGFVIDGQIKKAQVIVEDGMRTGKSNSGILAEDCALCRGCLPKALGLTADDFKRDPERGGPDDR